MACFRGKDLKGHIQIGVVILCSLGFPKGLVGQGPWRPSRQHYAAVLKAKDCSIYRAVAKDARLDIQATERLRDENLSTLRRARQALEQCGKRRGISQTPATDRESILAEVCPAEYEAWLSPGYKIQVVEEDLETERRSLASTQAHINRNCPSLPTRQ